MGREKAVVWLLAGTSAAAWVMLLHEGCSPSAEFTRTHLEASAAGAGLLGPFLAGWLLMLTAIMLPTTFPLQRLFSHMTRERRDHWQLTVLSVAGYVAVWASAGVAVYFGEKMLLALLHHWTGSRDLFRLGAVTLVGAGLFQFTPLKYRCLEKCRSPLTVILTHWTGRQPRKNALRLGLDHGLFCLGCCWTLMALMFTVGAGSMGWMLALGAMMALEKNFPWGNRMAKPLGSSLVLYGLVLLMR